MKHLALLFVAMTMMACSIPGDPPPVQVDVRDSLLGQGKILQITNTGQEVLTELKLEIKAPSGDQRSYSAAQISPNETLEVGWKKLDGWQIPSGAEITLRCKGYRTPYEGRVPESDASAGG